MENATKALLIAGSILIVILLIAFGMRIFNSTSGTAEQTQGVMQTTEMATFNSKFTSYVGTKNRAQVVSLLNTVIASNATNSHKVSIEATSDVASSSTSPADVLNNLKSLTSYKITINSTTGYTNGYVSKITISK